MSQKLNFVPKVVEFQKLAQREEKLVFDN